MENYDDAYKEVEKRLRAAPLKRVHIPCHHCTSVQHCKNVKTDLVPNITPFCVQPLAIFEDCNNDYLKQTTKKALYAKKTTKKAPPLEYIFLTINPKPSVDFEKFKKKFLLLLASRQFAGHTAVLEQRGTKEQLNIGQGFHAHILFKRHTPLNEGRPPTEIKRNLKQSWTNICDTKNPACFNIQFIGSDFAQDKEEYMLEEKTGKDKGPKQIGDKIWRHLKGLPPFYGDKTLVSALGA